jgi:hypothetical protein
MAEARRKPKSYTTRAKTVTSVMAATALLAGWNMIANLDRAKAQEPVTDASVDSALAAAPVVQPTAVPPTPVLLPTPTAAPGQSALRAIQLGIEPLQVEPIPTLLPLGALLARSSAGVMVPAGGSPAFIGVAPVPTLAPLPQLALRAMPSIPAPPSNNGGGGGGNNNNNSGGGSSSGGGNSNSGGGNSGGGNSSGGS